MMPTQDWIRKRGTLLRGHFLLSSGLHSDHYVQCARLFTDTKDAQRLGRALALLLPDSADLIVSPALGGLFIGYEVARAKNLPFIFTERLNGKMTLRRGFSIEPGQKVIIIEDVLTTGKSTLEVAQVVGDLGGLVVGVGCIIDRTGSKTDIGMPVASLMRLKLVVYEPEKCPLCAAGKPIDKPGSRPNP